MNKTHYSCAEFSALRLPGYPTTDVGWRKVVKREKWPFIEEKTQGGKRGIVRRFAMPANLPSRTKSRISQARTINKDAVALELFLTVDEAAQVLRFVSEMRGSGE